MSLPVRGAWIEISFASTSPAENRSLPVRGAWIEMAGHQPTSHGVLSLPVRGAWIEITTDLDANTAATVAPRAGSVD